MPYYSLAYNRLQYDITNWGTATNILLHLIEVSQNNLLRTITRNRRYCHVTVPSKNLGLYIKDILYID